MRVRSTALAVVAALVSATAGAAQDLSSVHKDDDGNGLVTLRGTVSGGSHAGFGLGYVHFELVNQDTRPHAVELEIRSLRFFDGDLSARRTLQLEPGAAELYLPLPVPPMRARLEFRVDGVPYSQRFDFPRSHGAMGLFVTDDAIAPLGLEVLAALPAARGAGAPPQQLVRSHFDVPTDWRMFTCYTAVVVDGRAVLDGERQEALRRYAFAGGTVVLTGAHALQPGALRELVSEVDARDGAIAHGLGHVAVIPSLGGDTTVMRRRLAALPVAGRPLWPAADELFLPQDIAGLGEAPVGIFLSVILLFAVLVGPVNFWMLRRRKKPLLALVTVPALGFGTTFLILAYGILHDGFDVRGVVTSVTVLDQVRHEAATVTQRTLFAGLAPNELTMGPDALLLSSRAATDDRDLADRWNWDADRERLDGGVLPSRTVTPLLTVQQGIVRERLTVRRSGDALELLADGGVDVVGRAVLCDLDGRYWMGGGGRLQPVDAASGAAELLAIQDRAAERRVPIDGEVRLRTLPPLVRAWDGPGAFAVEVRSAPWLDEHGLDVQYDGARHFVFGRMGPEDFVR